MKFPAFLYLLILVVFVGCSNGNAWEEANNIGTIDAYQEFIDKNSES